PLLWDVRYAPCRSARVSGEAISPSQLAQTVTIPAVTSLHVTSDLLSPHWVIAAYNPTGVTVDDILSAIHAELYAPLTILEWDYMSLKQRARIESVFYARCQASHNFERTRNGGVRRMDYLINTTTFAGLS
ncbi:hypothetical protein HYDPIDRAFT_56699, partial [Hydnomerulius pinastri MD-312]